MYRWKLYRRYRIRLITPKVPTPSERVIIQIRICSYCDSDNTTRRPRKIESSRVENPFFFFCIYFFFLSLLSYIRYLHSICVCLSRSTPIILLRHFSGVPLLPTVVSYFWYIIIWYAYYYYCHILSTVLLGFLRSIGIHFILLDALRIIYSNSVFPCHTICILYISFHFIFFIEFYFPFQYNNNTCIY